MEAQVAAVLDNNSTSDWYAAEMVAGKSPIWQPGYDSNTAGVAKDEDCPTQQVTFSSMFGSISINDTIPEIVVNRTQTFVLDQSTPRIKVIKIFGCFKWADKDGIDLQADQVSLRTSFFG